jgi:hypothetical protein
MKEGFQVTLNGKFRQRIRTRLQDRYGTSRATHEVNQYSEQMAYGHREVLTRYLGLPSDAYFKAILTHGKILSHELDPIRPQFSRDGFPLLQALWRSDAEDQAKNIKVMNVISIGATGLYELSNQGVGLEQIKRNIEKVSKKHVWSENRADLLDLFSGKKILYMPTHSWDGDVVKHTIEKVDFLKNLVPQNVTVCLGYLDFCDPKVRRIYSQPGWKIECAGVRASKAFGSPAGGREYFLAELFYILDQADVVIADELTTGQMYAACIGKEIGLLPEDDSVSLTFSSWQTSSNFREFNMKIRETYPWLIGNDLNNTMCEDISQALGVNRFRMPSELGRELPWYQEKRLEFRSTE